MPADRNSHANRRSSKVGNGKENGRVGKKSEKRKRATTTATTQASLSATGSNEIVVNPSFIPSRETKSKPKAGGKTATIPPLGKFLASSEKEIRDKAVAALSRYLSGRKRNEEIEQTNAVEDEKEFPSTTSSSDWVIDGEESEPRFSELSMLTLWKGLYFNFWMADKALVQQALANELALMTLQVRYRPSKHNNSEEKQRSREKASAEVDVEQGIKSQVRTFRCSLAYLRGFWTTMVREWSSLDRLRLDKFYLLIRRFVHVGFLVLKKVKWDAHAVKEYNDVLTGTGGPLHLSDSKIPHGLAYHLSDVYIDELEKALSHPLTEGSEHLGIQPLPNLASSNDSFSLQSILQPFLETLAIAPTSTMFNRVQENVFQPLLDSFLIPAQTVRPQHKRRKEGNENEREDDRGEDEDEDFPYPGILEATDPSTSQLPVDNRDGRKLAIGILVLEAIFRQGGEKDTTEVSRRKMYKIYRDKEPMVAKVSILP